MTNQTRQIISAYAVPPVPAKLAHFVFKTARFTEMSEWYANVLGAKAAFENEQLCFMTYDEEHHRIGIINVPKTTEKLSHTDAGLEHIAFTYSELGQLLYTYLRLREDGIEPFWTINHGPTISFYYYDPDHNKIELQYDVFSTSEDLDSFFKSGAYEENFIGIIFKPDEMITRYEAGMPIEELTKRPKLPADSSPWDMVRT